MCGFVSIINTSLGKQNLFDIIGQLKKIHYHRGPDEIKELHKSKFSILFRRLAIIDLSKNASQPFLSDDGLISLVFNGEIYNYRYLLKKNQLVTNKDPNDTNVLVNLFEKKKISNIIKEIDGMYAFVVYNSADNKIYISRDPQGEKSLYFFESHEKIIISSEIGPIIKLLNNVSFNFPGAVYG